MRCAHRLGDISDELSLCPSDTLRDEFKALFNGAACAPPPAPGTVETECTAGLRDVCPAVAQFIVNMGRFLLLKE